MPTRLTSFLLFFSLLLSGNLAAQDLKALIIEGQNNHKVWPKTTKMMKSYLEQTGLFTVEVATTAEKGTDPNFRPDFTQFDVIVSNYNGAPWPDETKTAFEKYMSEGGGLVVVHAADNAFGGWREYNEMIGLGGWNGRNEKSGPLIYLDENGEVIRDESAGPGGHHGRQHEFSVVIRDNEHPITAGLPVEFMHTKDELYDKLRGPGENMKILATSFADPATGGSGRHEPMIMTIDYGKGRVFHTPMGHADYSQECVGFINVFQRGTQWAATGEVTIEVPADFPGPDGISSRPFVSNVEAASLGQTKNVHRIGNLYTAGQMTAADIEAIKEAGIKHVITLRTDSELDWNEQKAMEDAGLEFHKIGFKSPEGLTDDVFTQVRKLLSQNADEKVLLHCGSANRVGAVWAAYRVLDQGVETDKAMEEAKTIGLSAPWLIEKANAYLENPTTPDR